MANTRTPIKEFGGLILGWIEEYSNGDKKATDYAGVVLGYYRKANNYTTDFQGRIIAQGDVVSSLILSSKR